MLSDSFSCFVSCYMLHVTRSMSLLLITYRHPNALKYFVPFLKTGRSYVFACFDGISNLSFVLFV